MRTLKKRENNSSKYAFLNLTTTEKIPLIIARRLRKDLDIIFGLGFNQATHPQSLISNYLFRQYTQTIFLENIMNFP